MKYNVYLNYHESYYYEPGTISRNQNHIPGWEIDCFVNGESSWTTELFGDEVVELDDKEYLKNPWIHEIICKTEIAETCYWFAVDMNPENGTIIYL